MGYQGVKNTFNAYENNSQAFHGFCLLLRIVFDVQFKNNCTLLQFKYGLIRNTKKCQLFPDVNKLQILCVSL